MLSKQEAEQACFKFNETQKNTLAEVVNGAIEEILATKEPKLLTFLSSCIMPISGRKFSEAWCYINESDFNAMLNSDKVPKEIRDAWLELLHNVQADIIKLPTALEQIQINNYSPFHIAEINQFTQLVNLLKAELDTEEKKQACDMLLRLRELYLEITPVETILYQVPQFEMITYTIRLGETPLNLGNVGPKPPRGAVANELIAILKEKLLNELSNIGKDEHWLEQESLAMFVKLKNYDRDNIYHAALLCLQGNAEMAPDFAHGINLLIVAAIQGHAAAQHKLAIYYANGNGVTKDLAEAIRLYTLAADQGLAAAQCNLGSCYKNGDGVAKDPTKAVMLYKSAAAQGLAIAQYNLAVCYKDGDGVAQDLAEVVRLYRLAAAQGLAAAQSELGLCYEDGKGIAQNLPEAIKLYRLAAAQGYAEAQCNLGNCYASGKGVKQNLSDAVILYRSAAEKGFAMAQHNLALCYARGEGVARDLTEAIKLYTLAAEQGCAGAQCNLATCYRDGKGVERNLPKAIQLYTSAAKQGLAGAQYNLALCYECGQGVAQDLSKAIEWYTLAAKQGLVKAQEKLEIYRQKIANFQQNTPQFNQSQQQAQPFTAIVADGYQLELKLKKILDTYKATDLALAFRRAAGFGTVEELTLMLKINPEIINSIGVVSKQTALDIAIEKSKEQNIDFLLRNGALKGIEIIKRPTVNL